MPDLTFTIGYLRVFGIVHGIYARLAQSAERKALNLVVVGSSPTVGVLFSGLSLGTSKSADGLIKLPSRQWAWVRCLSLCTSWVLGMPVQQIHCNAKVSNDF